MIAINSMALASVQVSYTPTDLEINTGSNNSWFFLYSKKNAILDNAIFIKNQLKYENSLSTDIQYYSDYAIAALYFPQRFSFWSDYKSTASTDLAIRTCQKLSMNPSFLKGSFFNTQLRANFGGDSIAGLIGDFTYGLYTFIEGSYSLGYKCQIGIPNIEFCYHTVIRSSSYYPLDALNNSEYSINLGIENLNIAYYYPTAFQLIRENYPYQDRRWQIRYNGRFNDFDGFSEAVLQKDNQWYSIGLAYQLNGGELQSFISKGNQDHLTLGISYLWNNQLEDKQSVTKPSYLYSYKKIVNTVPYNTMTVDSLLFSSYDDYSLDQLKQALNTPTKVVDYVYNHLNYSDDHNYIDGLFDMYTPEQVVSNKKGNCTEQARFQASILKAQGYENLRIVGHISYQFAHAVLFYKEPTTNKWRAIDNTFGKVYSLDADTIEELYSQVYPCWFSLTVKDDNAKGLYQVDSETKWYIEDWFEK